MVHRAELPEMKRISYFYEQTVQEGLLDTETPINTAQKSIEKFSGGKARCMNCLGGAPGQRLRH